VATIRREIEVQAPPRDVGATWDHFIQRALSGKRRLVCDELASRMTHDIVVFNDYIERGGVDAGRPTLEEDVLLEKDADARGAKPSHVRLSAEAGTTFWRSYFPT